LASYQSRTKADGKTTVTARIRVAGVEETRTFTTKTAAKRWAQRREAEIRDAPALAGTEARKHTLADAIDRYREHVLPGLAQGTQTKYSQHLEWWRAEYGKLPLDRFGAAQIAEAQDRLSTEKTRRNGQKTEQARSPATVNRYVASLAVVMAEAHRSWHWVTSNPALAVKKKTAPKGRARFLSDKPGPDGTSELSRLLDACRISESPDLYLAVLLAVTTGGRRNEIMSLTWDDIELEKGTVTLSGEKTKRPRTVALAPEAAELLRQRRGIGKALVFPAPPDPKRPDRPPTPVDLESAWQTALRRARISDFRWHDLRHTCASYMAMEGASLAEIANVLGHRTLQMVGRYSHLSEEHIAAASTKAAERLAGRRK
jgi:integrase